MEASVVVERRVRLSPVAGGGGVVRYGAFVRACEQERNIQG